MQAVCSHSQQPRQAGTAFTDGTLRRVLAGQERRVRGQMKCRKIHFLSCSGMHTHKCIKPNGVASVAVSQSVLLPHCTPLSDQYMRRAELLVGQVCGAMSCRHNEQLLSLLCTHVLHAHTALKQQIVHSVVCFADKPARQGSISSIGFLDARNQSA